jgi:hypothetical protein
MELDDVNNWVITEMHRVENLFVVTRPISWYASCTDDDFSSGACQFVLHCYQLIMEVLYPTLSCLSETSQAMF